MVISRTGDSIAANSRSANLLAGEQFEFLPSRCLIRIRMSASAVGLRADFQVGGISIVVNGAVPGTNRFPVIPDDHLLEVGGNRGERLFLTVLNTTAGALTVNTVVDILPY